MGAALEQRASRIGALVAVLAVALLVAVGFIMSDAGDRSQIAPGINRPEGPLAGGTKMSLSDAIAIFDRPVFRPEIELAGDDSLSGVWVRTEASPEVWLEYESGIVVYVRPLDDLQSTRAFAEAQSADGVRGEVVDVSGVDVFIADQGDGRVTARFVLGNSVVVVANIDGSFSGEQIQEVSRSIVESANRIAAEHASAK